MSTDSDCMFLHFIFSGNAFHIFDTLCVFTESALWVDSVLELQCLSVETLKEKKFVDPEKTRPGDLVMPDPFR